MTSFINRTFQNKLITFLKKFDVGRLEMTLPDGSVETFGKGASGPTATMRIKHEEFFKQCVLKGNAGMGEAYINGDWDTQDIRAVIEWFARNTTEDKRTGKTLKDPKIIGVLRWMDRMNHLLRGNSKSGSRRNIEEHYDLGNDFYQLWLDPTMTYSCGKFTSATETLDEAQENKYRALCDKLQLSETDHVLEIGCGWGGFSIFAAGNYGCKVTGVTISPAQHEEAVARIKAAGLEDKIEIRLQDYRDIEGQFDKIASIEMLEAVGDQYLETWCSKVDEVLKPNGLVAVQMITVPDFDHEPLKKGTDFIQKHIFPGSLLLSVGRMNEAFNQTGNLFLHDLEDMGTSYHRTLRHWFENFNASLDQVRQQGFDDKFIRKWNYYLKYCEAGFRTRTISVVQGVYTRPYNFDQLTKEDGVPVT